MFQSKITHSDTLNFSFLFGYYSDKGNESNDCSHCDNDLLLDEVHLYNVRHHSKVSDPCNLKSTHTNHHANTRNNHSPINVSCYSIILFYNSLSFLSKLLYIFIWEYDPPDAKTLYTITTLPNQYKQ